MCKKIKTIERKVVDLIHETVTSIPEDVERALKIAYENEKSELARIQLKTILENIKIAREEGIPVCQDTGIFTFYVGINEGGNINPRDLEKAIITATKKATKEVPLRENVVHPITREATNDNIGYRIPIIEFEFNESLDKNEVLISLLVKGAGSENMSFLAMLEPSQSLDGIKNFVLKKVKEAKGKPCPPTILGIGIGGTSDLAMKLAKKALLRSLDDRNHEKVFAKMEKDLLEKINSLGIGPMGLGGKTTCLGVKIEHAYCHTASLPIGLVMQCWAHRKSSIKLEI